MKLSIEQVQIILSQKEAAILLGILENILMDDPLGEVSTQLGMNINEVVGFESYLVDKLRHIRNVY